MRPWIRSYQLFLDFCPRRALLAAPGSYKAHILHARIYGHAEFDFDTPEAPN